MVQYLEEYLWSQDIFNLALFHLLLKLIPIKVTLLHVGLNPYIPVKRLGILMLPPISPPIPNGEAFNATIADSPPELPPELLKIFIGFF